MKYKLLTLLFIGLASHFFGGTAFAMVYEQPQGLVLDLEYPFKSQSFNLVDVNFRYIYEILPPEQGLYEAHIINENGLELAKRKITLENGKNEIIIPYFPDATKITFTDPSGKLLSGINTEVISVCNNNGACQFDKGESVESCPSDCKGDVVPDNIAASEEVKTETDWIKVIIWALGFLAVIVFCIIVYIYVKIKR